MDYFDVSVMDVAAALMAKIKLRYSTDCEPEVTDRGEKAFDPDDLGDYVVSMIIAVVTRGEDEILEVQPCGQSEPQRGRGDGLHFGSSKRTPETNRRTPGLRNVWTGRCLFFRWSSSRLQTHIHVVQDVLYTYRTYLRRG